MFRMPVRYSLVFLLMLATSIFFGSRSILSISAGSLSADLSLDTVQLGYLFSSFSVTYVLFQIPCGMLLDRLDTKKLYLFFLLFWSLVAIGTYFVSWLPDTAWMFLVLLVFRLLMGLFEAPIFPANSRIVSRWFPRHEISFASAIFGSSQYLSIFVFSPLIAWVTVNQGWQYNFLYLGIAALLIGLLLNQWLHWPKNHPSISRAELDYLVQHQLGNTKASAAPTKPLAQRLRLLLTNRTMLGVCFGQYCMNAIMFFFLTWFPVYLVEVKHIELLSVGLIASVPAIFGFLGNLSGGLISDRLLRMGLRLSLARKLPIISGMVFSTCMLLALFTHSQWWIIVWMSVAFFGKGFSSLGWTIVADIAPASLYGLCAGIFNTCGNLSGIVTPLLIGYLIDKTGMFDIALYVTGLHAIGAIGCFLWLVGDLNKIAD